MDKTLTLRLNTGTAELRQAVQEMFVEMDAIDQCIALNQAETARLRAETRAMLGQLTATLRGPAYVAADR